MYNKTQLLYILIVRKLNNSYIVIKVSFNEDKLEKQSHLIGFGHERIQSKVYM